MLWITTWRWNFQFFFWYIRNFRTLLNVCFCFIRFQKIVPFIKSLLNFFFGFFNSTKNENCLYLKIEEKEICLLNLLIFCFTIPMFGCQLAFTKKSAMHHLYHQISFLGCGHIYLGNTFGVALKNKKPFYMLLHQVFNFKTYIIDNNFAHGTTFTALLSQIILIVQYKLYFLLKEIRMEKILDDNTFLMFKTFTAHLLRSPIEKSVKEQKCQTIGTISEIIYGTYFSLILAIFSLSFFFRFGLSAGLYSPLI